MLKVAHKICFLEERVFAWGLRRVVAIACPYFLRMLCSCLLSLTLVTVSMGTSLCALLCQQLAQWSFQHVIKWFVVCFSYQNISKQVGTK